MSLWKRAAVVLALAALAVGANVTSVSAQSPTFTLPAGAPTPGTGFRVLAAYKVAFGVQIYTCTAAGTWSTPTSTPEAVLLRYGRFGLIHHHAGPRWTSARDGSTIVGAVKDPVKDRVPKDGTIPWLLVTVTAHENSSDGDELNDVAFVSRVNTTGGVGPTGTCTPGRDRDRAVPYGADYVFWVGV